MPRNKNFWPAHIERNVLVFEMTLDGFDDKEIASAMSIKSWNLSKIRQKLFEIMMESDRIGNRAPASVEHVSTSLRKYATFWHGRLFALKVELGMVDEKSGVVCK